MNQLANRQIALNKIAKTQRVVAPLVAAYFEENELTRKVDGDIVKKQGDAVKAIISAHNAEGLQCWLSTTGYSAAVVFKTSYAVSEYGCSYIEEYFYIGSEFVALPLYTYLDLSKSRKRLAKVRANLKDLHTEECKLKRLLGR